MKIRPSYIFTVLGNAIDHIQEGYISNNIVHIPLSIHIVNECLDTLEEISSHHYSIWADFSRKGLVDIYAEPDDDNNDDDVENSENINLINFDDLFECLEFTESESLFDMVCKMIYTNAPEI